MIHSKLLVSLKKWSLKRSSATDFLDISRDSWGIKWLPRAKNRPKHFVGSTVETIFYWELKPSVIRCSSQSSEKLIFKRSSDNPDGILPCLIAIAISGARKAILMRWAIYRWVSLFCLANPLMDGTNPVISIWFHSSAFARAFWIAMTDDWWANAGASPFGITSLVSMPHLFRWTGIDITCSSGGTDKLTAIRRQLPDEKYKYI